MPVLERIDWRAAFQNGLRQLAVVEADVAEKRLFEVLAAAETVALEHVLDPTVEPLDHAVGLRPHRWGQAMLDPEPGAEAVELVIAGRGAATRLNLPDEKTRHEPTGKAAVLAARRAHFGANQKPGHADPVMLVRGWKHHLFDEWGRPCPDACNNVPHVGHAHPRIQAVAADQLKRMNSNTRYLHPARTAFAEKLLSKFPVPPEVCFFVNSGAKGMVTPDHGYHGNTTGAIAASACKFNAKGGAGQSDRVELVEVADDYRGSFGRDDPDRAEKFAGSVDDALARLAARDIGVAGFIAGTFPSVGGQIIPPKSSMRKACRPTPKFRAPGFCKT